MILASRVSIPFVVPCPFFAPVAPWPENEYEPWPGPRRVPLGEPYRGTCTLTPEAIDPQAQAMICNFGYAKGRCRHFPESANDAVRFSIPSSTSEQIHLIWITEREHAPTAHGSSLYKQGTFEPSIPQEFMSLALAFIETYLKGKSPQGLLK